MRSTDLGISFFTTLTVVANLATIAVVGLAIAGRWSGEGAAHLWSQLRAELVAGGLALAWLVAAVSTGGSLWFSEGAGFEPCQLCWVQRGFMYPLVLVLAVAVWSRTRVSARSDGAGARLGAVATGTRALTLVMAAGGAIVAAYHYLVERYPSLETVSCDPDLPCSLVWFERLGFVTLPYMALSAFVLIGTLTLAAGPARAPLPHLQEPSS